MDSVRISKSEPCIVYISLEDNFNKTSFNIDDRYLIIGQNIQYALILTEKTKGIKYLFPNSSNYDGDMLLKIEELINMKLIYIIIMKKMKINMTIKKIQ